MRYVLGAIDKARGGYVAVVRRLARVAIVGVVVVAGVLAASALLFSKTPQSFLPDEDQGAIFAALRLPEGASINRTEAVVKQVEDIVRPIPGVEGMLSVVGLNFIDYVASSNQAFFVIRLKPYEERTDPAQSAERHHRALAAATGGDRGRHRISVQPAAHSRPGQYRRLSICAGGVAGPVADRCRGGDARLDRGGQSAARACRSFQHLCRRHAANLSRYRSRQGAGPGRQDQRHFQCAAIDAGQFLRQRLQRFRPHLAGQRPGRHAVSQPAPTTSTGFMCATPRAAWSRSRALAEAKLVQGPQTVVRYNGYRGAIVNGAPKPGYSSGQALAAMERISADDIAGRLQLRMDRDRAPGEGGQRPTTGIVLGLAVLFAYLFLVALYESWNIPLPALLSVSVAMLGAIVAVAIAGLSFDVYAQIGLVVLIALAAKNGILIVAFAVEQRKLGKDITTPPSRRPALRFRPVMMTSFAFIFGLFPLVIAKGAGAVTRHAVGTPVFGGMIAASIFGIFSFRCSSSPPNVCVDGINRRKRVDHLSHPRRARGADDGGRVDHLSHPLARARR